MKKKLIPKKKEKEVILDDKIKEEIEEEKEYEETEEEEVQTYKSLDEVVDKSKLYSLIFSGVENPQYFNILYNMGVRNFLMSYHYISGKKLDMTPYREKGIKFFIDSGVYTFLNNADKYGDLDESHWEQYIKNYLNWARANKDVIFAIANVDLEYYFGNEKVDEWNEKYFEPFMLETGIPVCFIWHDCRGEDGWEDYCKRYPYTGFSWVSGDATDLDFNYGLRMLRVAEKNGAVCHGMGMTRTSLLTKLPFYSSDSSVDGKSSVLVKDSDGSVLRTSIEDLYKTLESKAFRTTPTEMWIDTIPNNYKVLTVDNNNKIVWEKLKAVVKHNVKKPTVKLSIEGGKDITCTTDHSIITMTKEGNLVETKADELKVGDYVLSPKSYNLENPITELAEVMIQKPGYVKTHGELQMVEISDVYLQFLGLWVGDGSYTSTSNGDLAFSCYQDLECKEVIDIICSLYNAKPMVQSNGIDVKISNVRMRRIMEAFEFTGNSKTKRIPSFIYSLNKKQICKFLQGYFSADGTGTCECSTVSEELKNDLVELLNMLGIYTSVSFRKAKIFEKDGKKYNASDIWHISIKDTPSRILFRNYIGFLQQYKNLKLEEVINNSPTIRGAKRTGIPKELAITSTIKTDDKHSTSINTFKGRISRKYNNGFNEKVLNSEVDFLQIKNIEYVTDGSKEVEVYDLSVDKYERFIANGILVHNTTWLVGLQYGEVNYWTGKKMTRLKKEKWKGEYLSDLVSYGLDRDKLLDEDKDEMIKANVIAFIEAEKYIHTKLKSKMYWLKPQKVTNNVDSFKFPSLEWCLGESDFEGYQEVARLMNINPDLDVDDVSDYIIDCTVMLNWDNGEYEEIQERFDEEHLRNLHRFYINQVKVNIDDIIDDLVKFFTDVLEGRNDKLLLMGTDFDRVSKERDNYIEEDEFDIVDVPLEEYQEQVQAFLPPPDSEAPEIDELDKEIFDQTGYIAVRDNKGRFIKGQKRVRNRKNIYSEKYPKMSCNTCYAAQSCPEFKEGYVCAFNKMFKRFDSRNAEDVLDAMSSMVNLNMERMQRVAIFEMLDGGSPDSNLTNMIDQNMRLLQQMREVQNSQEVVRQTRVMRADGSMEQTTHVSSNAPGGVMEMLMKQMMNKSAKSDDEEINKEL